MRNYLDVLGEEVARQGMSNSYYSVISLTDAEEDEKSKGELYHLEAKQFHNGNAAHDSYSVAKCITALGLGVLYDRGLVKPEDKIGDYLGEYFPKDKNPGLRDVTLADIMHHSAGFQYGIDFDEVDAKKWEDGEWLHTLFAIPQVEKPGQSFIYSDGNYYIIGRVIELLAGCDAGQFLEEQVFTPLGFHVNAWSRDNAGHTVCGTGLYMRTEDMAKLAWLMMEHGMWGNRRIVSAKWIDKITDCEIGLPQKYGFGMGPVGDGYGSGGAYGQGFCFNRRLRVALAWHSFGTPGLMEICGTL